LQLQIPGEHNALNATAVFATALHLGFEPTSILAGLNNYSGTKRRFELKGMQNGVRVVDDYGHHPTEISATLKAARSFAGTGRVLVIFQPHRFSRTQAFEKEFAQSLAACDFAVILEIYAASETAIAGVSGLSIAKHLPNTKAKFQPAMIEAVEEICNMAKPGDVIITLGAGDVSSLGEPILNKLSTNK
jgi:UDP-N-acetylmuramate--alanine ligase